MRGVSRLGRRVALWKALFSIRDVQEYMSFSGEEGLPFCRRNNSKVWPSRAVSFGLALAQFPGDLAKDAKPNDGVALRQMEPADQPADTLF